MAPSSATGFRVEGITFLRVNVGPGRVTPNAFPQPRKHPKSLTHSNDSNTRNITKRRIHNIIGVMVIIRILIEIHPSLMAETLRSLVLVHDPCDPKMNSLAVDLCNRHPGSLTLTSFKKSPKP